MDPVHRDIKLIIMDQYQSHMSLKGLATEMDLRLVEFVSVLVRWVDDIFESLFDEVNGKEDVWWIATRVIRSIFEDYLAPYWDNPTRTYFGSDTHRRSNLVWGVICFYLTE